MVIGGVQQSGRGFRQLQGMGLNIRKTSRVTYSLSELVKGRSVLGYTRWWVKLKKGGDKVYVKKRRGSVAFATRNGGENTFC